MLTAIRRSYTTNDAMFDPDFCGVFILWEIIAIFCASYACDNICTLIATKSVQRAKGHEVHIPTRNFFAQGKKRRLVFNESLKNTIIFATMRHQKSQLCIYSLNISMVLRECLIFKGIIT